MGATRTDATISLETAPNGERAVVLHGSDGAEAVVGWIREVHNVLSPADRWMAFRNGKWIEPPKANLADAARLVMEAAAFDLIGQASAVVKGLEDDERPLDTVDCPACDDEPDGAREACTVCQGRGWLRHDERPSNAVECRHCGGDGWIDRDSDGRSTADCGMCDGRGWVLPPAWPACTACGVPLRELTWHGLVPATQSVQVGPGGPFWYTTDYLAGEYAVRYECACGEPVPAEAAGLLGLPAVNPLAAELGQKG